MDEDQFLEMRYEDHVSGIDREYLYDGDFEYCLTCGCYMPDSGCTEDKCAVIIPFPTLE